MSKYSVKIARKVGYIGGALMLGEIADVRDYLIDTKNTTREQAKEKAIALYLKDFPQIDSKAIFFMGVARRLRP